MSQFVVLTPTFSKSAPPHPHTMWKEVASQIRDPAHLPRCSGLGQKSHLMQGLLNYWSGRDQSDSLSPALTGLQAWNPGRGVRPGKGAGENPWVEGGGRWDGEGTAQAPSVHVRTPHGWSWTSLGCLPCPHHKPCSDWGSFREAPSHT